jgi:hypothetical protein
MRIGARHLRPSNLVWLAILVAMWGAIWAGWLNRGLGYFLNLVFCTAMILRDGGRSESYADLDESARREQPDRRMLFRRRIG